MGRILPLLQRIALLAALASCAACAAEQADSGAEWADDASQDTSMSDTWAGSQDAVASCREGERRPAGDGCNACTCQQGVWACTALACAEVCPAPTGVSGGAPCSPVAVWAKSALGACCLYQSACDAPVDWRTYFSEQECAASCATGEQRLAEDGCNTCSCEGERWVCTALACPVPQACVSDADCFATGCSGELCAAMPADSTCEWRAEYACFDAPMTSCGCIDGLCGWAQTTELASCLGQTAACVAGDSRDAGDGCNVCRCDEAGGWACTTNACAQCPAPQPDGDVCDAPPVWARDPLTNLCCAYSNACGAPAAWDTFASSEACYGAVPKACTPGEKLETGDGCNTCTCEAGVWACTEMACPQLCATDADCVVTGCSGQLCAAQHVYTACDWVDSHACFREPFAQCGCQDGVCAWSQSEALTQCLQP